MSRAARLAACARVREVEERLRHAARAEADDLVASREVERAAALAAVDDEAGRLQALLRRGEVVAPAALGASRTLLALAEQRVATTERALAEARQAAQRRRAEHEAARAARRTVEAAVERAAEGERASAARAEVRGLDEVASTRAGRRDEEGA